MAKKDEPTKTIELKEEQPQVQEPIDYHFVEPKEETKEETIEFANHLIIVEPRENDCRVVLATKHGLYVTEAIGEKEEAIEKVKAYVTSKC